MYKGLICDDQPDIVNALKIYLAPEGYELFAAYNGEEAVALMQKEDIHLILLDVMMPKMDGITAIAKIREFSNVPIILLTAKSETEDMVLACMLAQTITSQSLLCGGGAGKSPQPAAALCHRHHRVGVTLQRKNPLISSTF